MEKYNIDKKWLVVNNKIKYLTLLDWILSTFTTGENFDGKRELTLFLGEGWSIHTSRMKLISCTYFDTFINSVKQL